MRALADHIHLAVIGEDVVLLDTTADAYLCIPDGLAHVRPSADRVHLAPTTDAEMGLEAAGYLAPGAKVSERARIARPGRNLEDSPRPDITVADICRLGLAVYDLLVRYRGHALGDILHFADQRQPPAVGSTDLSATEVERLARVYRTLAPWLPIGRKCLIQSFVLLRFLQRSGHRATWVLGVATWPFSAHCWIQSGDQVLDDYWERILVYEPILAVR